MSATRGFTGVKLVQRTQLVREQLERAIERGDYKPGDRLPSERQLVEMIGVSRVSVREAIRSLEAIGLIEVQHGRGCFVAERRDDGFAASVEQWLGSYRDEVLELLRVRGALEELAAESAAEQGNRAALKAISQAQAAFAAAARAKKPALEQIVERDIEFHQAIARASGSALLEQLLDDLNGYLTESRLMTLAPAGRPPLSAAEHAEIEQAILAGDAAGARAAIARHIEAVRRAIAEAEAGRE